MRSSRLFLNRFNLIRELGEGSYGMVVLAEDTQTSIKVALKIIQKSSILKMSHINRLRREINLLRLLRHPNIVRLYEVVETFDQMILVMEYISGGDLFDRIIESRRLDDETARKIFRQLFSAIMYCHDNMMVHRDLKPENLLLDDENNLKIIDFGFVRTYSKDPHMTLKTYCGSLYYCAPEMIDGTPYPGPSSDIWSLGIILYVITNGYLPFRDSNLEDLYESLRTANYDKGEYSSEECNELIAKMIVADPRERTNLASLASHPWLNNGYDALPTPFSDLNNDLIQFRDEVAKKIDVLETQESAVELQIKSNGLKYLSLLIPIENESSLKGNQIPLMSKSKSDPHEYSSAPSRVITHIESHLLAEISESNSGSESTKSVSQEKTETVASIPDSNTVQSNSREYCSAPPSDRNVNIIKQSSDSSNEPDKPQLTEEEPAWKTKIVRWWQKHNFFQKPDDTPIKSRRRFSFLLKK